MANINQETAQELRNKLIIDNKNQLAQKSKKMLLIINPRAGKGKIKNYLLDIVNKFNKNKFEVTVYATQKYNDAYEKVLKQGQNYDYVVCAGGDGTLSEVINALMPLAKKPKLGYLPAGTTNDFANSLGIPFDLKKATYIICHGEPKAVDIGRFNKSYFSYVAAFGLFTDVSYATSQGTKNFLGHLAYILEGIKRLTNIKNYQCTFHLKNINDGKIEQEYIKEEFILGAITNSSFLGGFKLPGDEEIINKPGEFRLILVKKIPSIIELQKAIAVLKGANEESNSFLVRSFQSLTYDSLNEINWTIDGEYGGKSPKGEILVCADALKIMCPKN